MGSIVKCKDIDYEILLMLSDEDLFTIFQVNKYYNEISKEDYFWKQKLKVKINPYINKCLLQPNKLSYKKAFENTSHTIFTLQTLNLDNTFKNGDIIDVSDTIYIAKDDKLNNIQFMCYGPAGPMNTTTERDYYTHIYLDEKLFKTNKEIETYDYLYKYITQKNNCYKITINCYILSLATKKFLWMTRFIY